MHIGTRRMQQILLKDALLLGVDVRYGLQFDQVMRPDAEQGRPYWRLAVRPMVGRDGKPRDPPELLATAEVHAQEVAKLPFDSVYIGIGQQAPVVSEAPDGRQQLNFVPIVEPAAPMLGSDSEATCGYHAVQDSNLVRVGMGTGEA